MNSKPTISATVFIIQYSNDDDNLYLTVRAGDGYSNEKSIFGISFMIKIPVENGDKSKENVSVTFPVPINTQQSNPLRYTVETIRKLQHDTTNRVKKMIDSLKSLANKGINESFKEIQVTGIKEVQGSTISIYNTEGINAAAQFNEHMQYTYELAIPLKYLGKAVNSRQKFNYNIKMKGVPEKSPGSPYPLAKLTGNEVEVMGPDNTYVMYPTDFSGTYTLVKN